MAEFTYHVDRKFTIWGRDTFTVKADSQAEADRIMQQEAINKTLLLDPIAYVDLQHDTLEHMSVSDNHHAATICLFNSNGDDIWDNNIGAAPLD